MVAHSLRRFRLFSRGTGTDYVPRIPVPFRIRKNRLQRPVTARFSFRQHSFFKRIAKSRSMFRRTYKERFLTDLGSSLGLGIHPSRLVRAKIQGLPRVIRTLRIPNRQYQGILFKLFRIQLHPPTVGVCHHVPAAIEFPDNFVTRPCRIPAEQQRTTFQGTVPKALFSHYLVTAILPVLPEIAKVSGLVPVVEHRVGIPHNGINLYIRKRNHSPSIRSSGNFRAHCKRGIERHLLGLVRKCCLQHILSGQQRIFCPDTFIRRNLHFFDKAGVFQDNTQGIRQ